MVGCTLNIKVSRLKLVARLSIIGFERFCYNVLNCCIMVKLFRIHSLNSQCAPNNARIHNKYNSELVNTLLMDIKIQATKAIKKFILISFITLLSACSNYKLEIQQGNLVTQESVSKLQRGMTRQQVQSLLGTPLMQDSFNNNRWDYVFYQSQDSNNSTSKNITLFFKDNQLVNVTN